MTQNMNGSLGDYCDRECFKQRPHYKEHLAVYKIRMLQAVHQ